MQAEEQPSSCNQAYGHAEREAKPVTGDLQPKPCFGTNRDSRGKETMT